MDKYVRNDDMNDDSEGGRGETYPGLTHSRFKHQELTTIGIREEQEIKYGQKLSTLSPQEKLLFNLLTEKCLSIHKAAKRMRIARQTAQEYWNNIKDKMK